MLHRCRMGLSVPRYFCNEPGCTHQNSLPTEHYHEFKATRRAQRMGHDVVPVVSLFPGDWA